MDCDKVCRDSQPRPLTAIAHRPGNAEKYKAVGGLPVVQRDARPLVGRAFEKSEVVT
jgi:hypothetical protein